MNPLGTETLRALRRALYGISFPSGIIRFGLLISMPLLLLLEIVFIYGKSGTMIWPLVKIYLQDLVDVEAWLLAAISSPVLHLSALLPPRIGTLSEHWDRKLLMAAGALVRAVASLFRPILRSILTLAELVMARLRESHPPAVEAYGVTAG